MESITITHKDGSIICYTNVRVYEFIDDKWIEIEEQTQEEQLQIINILINEKIQK